MYVLIIDLMRMVFVAVEKTAAVPGGAGKQKAVAAAPIEDWQLPLRYRRQPLSQQEIDYINVNAPVNA
jgi:hypothetical protein